MAIVFSRHHDNNRNYNYMIRFKCNHHPQSLRGKIYLWYQKYQNCETDAWCQSQICLEHTMEYK